MPKTYITKSGENTDFHSCASGEPHVWEYQGVTKQEYRCKKCGLFAKKPQLKEATD